MDQQLWLGLTSGRVLYYDVGPEHPPLGSNQTPVVILHGFPDHSGNYKRFISGLCGSHRVLAFDRLGSGLSEKPKRLYSLFSQVEELREFLDLKKIEKANLLGHSCGGTLAILFARKYPQRVRSTILLNPVFRDFEIQTGPNRLLAFFLQSKGIGELMLAFHPKFMTHESLKLAFLDAEKITPAMVDSYHFPFSMPGGKQSYLSLMRSIYRMTDGEMIAACREMKAQKIPVLTLRSEGDWAFPLSDAETLVAEIGGMRLINLERVGHSPHLEYVDRDFQRFVLRPIQQFLGET